MDYNFSVNRFLTSDITKINNALLPTDYNQRGDKYKLGEMNRNIIQIIDQMGARSSKAQGIMRQITSAEKLRKSEDQIVYLLKDSEGCGGKGEVVGLLKIGPKFLFVKDLKDATHKINPLCVLDFYVVENRQRQGLGQRLFNYMLQDQQVSLTKLAIDSPSPRLQSFLKKNYGITGLITQGNKYALPTNYFDDMADEVKSSKTIHYQSNNSHNNNLETTSSQPSSRYGRYAGIRPVGSMAMIIHGDVDTASSSSDDPRHGMEPSYWDDNELKRWAEPIVDHEEYQIQDSSKSATPIEGEVKHGTQDQGDLHLAVAGNNNSRPISPAGSTPAPRQDGAVTAQGHFDLKFYHNKLW